MIKMWNLCICSVCMICAMCVLCNVQHVYIYSMGGAWHSEVRYEPVCSA